MSKKKTASTIYTALIMLFLFAPILVLIFFSFNSSKSLSVFSGFSLNWYRELFKDRSTLLAVRNTLILAVVSSIISTVMGTAAAVGINKLRNRFYKDSLNLLTNIPMTNPDIITGISLMLMFVYVGRMFGSATSLNFWTMLIAHVTFGLPYVILQVLPKLKAMDKQLSDAALDLGCTPVRAFFKVELPEISPGIITGMIMAFTMSLDDFVISYFTAGNGFQTLPIRIYNMTKKTVTPKMYALSTLIFFAILFMLILTNLTDEDALTGEGVKKESKLKKNFGKLPVYIFGGVLAASVIAAVCITAFKKDSLELNVYNWGEYISDGSEDSFDTVAEFEKWYEEEYGVPVTVNYTTFASNEDMYAKLKSGAVSYDVIVPSDYMIARMREENMLLPIDFGNVPNYEYIDDAFHGMYYDPDDTYSVPYTFSVVGVIYNANVVDEEDIGDWDLLWNEKYKGQILQYNNSRDALGTAQYKLGIDVNTSDKAEWQRALDELIAQRPLVKSYVMDEIYNMMESGEAAISTYYAGDYFTMIDAQADDVDLQFYYPQDTNYFIDAMCIPSCCQNKELAEAFINYMLAEEPAIANAVYTYYPSPNNLVKDSEEYIDEIGEDVYEILYPDLSDFTDNYNKYAYRNLDPELLSFVNSLWETLKIN